MPALRTEAREFKLRRGTFVVEGENGLHVRILEDLAVFLVTFLYPGRSLAFLRPRQRPGENKTRTCDGTLTALQ